VGTRCADHVTPLYPQKLALTSPTGGGRSVGIVRVRTKATEFLPKCMEATSIKSNNQFLHTEAVRSVRKEINFDISPRLTTSFKGLYIEYPN